MSNYLFIVTRQKYYYSGEKVVEIAQGGRDYSGSDMLVPKYRREGEGEEFVGMTDAVEAAIKVAQKWQSETEDSVFIAIGNNHGMGMEFEGLPLSEDTFKELREKAKELDGTLEHCAQCGEILAKERFGNADFDEAECCSEYCAEKYYAPVLDDEEWGLDDEES